MVRLQVSNHKNSSTLDPTQSGVMHIKIDGQVAQMTPPPPPPNQIMLDPFLSQIE
jgi:hypothetical protein